jgi:hypothetical protein
MAVRKEMRLLKCIQLTRLGDDVIRKHVPTVCMYIATRQSSRASYPKHRQRRRKLRVTYLRNPNMLRPDIGPFSQRELTGSALLSRVL